MRVVLQNYAKSNNRFHNSPYWLVEKIKGYKHGTKNKKTAVSVTGLSVGTLPATKVMSTELLSFFDSPIIEQVVKKAVAVGISEIILVTKRGKEAIEKSGW